MKTKCPHCSTLQNAPDEAAGREALCRSCRDKFTIAEYTPPVIVPLPEPPDPDDIPITVDAPPPRDRSDNIFARAWIGIPGPFKTAFLATLGVVSALLFAWYVTRIPRWFPRGPQTPTSSARQTIPTDRRSPGHLTELIHCCEDYAVLDTIQTLRKVGANSSNPLGWMFSAETNVTVLLASLGNIDKRSPCADPDARLCSAQLRSALLAELECQRFIAAVAANARPADTDVMAALVDESVRRAETALASLILLTSRYGVFE